MYSANPHCVLSLPLRPKSDAEKALSTYLSGRERLYFCGPGCCANGPSAFMSMDTMRMHEAARRNGKAAKGMVWYEQMWNEVMGRQKE